MLYIVEDIVHLFFRVLSIVVIVDVILTYFMSPYHPVREALDRIVEPLLLPIRRIVPTIGAIDFSPVILIVLIQVLDSVIGGLIRSI